MNKSYDYKMTIDGREIGGSVNGPQKTASEVVDLLKSHNPKVENVAAVEVKAAVPAKVDPPKPEALPHLSSVLANAEQKS